MCDVGEVLSKDLDEVGELPPEELATWAAHLERRRDYEDAKWDLRMLGLCTAFAAIFVKDVEFDAAKFFPSLFKDRAAAKAEPIDEAIVERQMQAWCVAMSAAQGQLKKEQ